MVPFGPRLLFKISCKPFAADILIANAYDARATSAFGFKTLIADIFRFFYLFFLNLNKNDLTARDIEKI
jgi:hypothetical protein